MTKEAQIINKYQGCILGSAVGDALGAPFEFMSPQTIGKRYGAIREMLGGGAFGWKPGETTDDTDNSLCIIDSLNENNKYVPADIARRFLLWYEGRPKDVGGTTGLSLSLLAKGHSWRDSGRLAVRLGARAGNGSLMRTEPVGLYLRGKPKDIDRVAAQISAITHADPDCIIACQMASHLVAFLATGYPRFESIDLLKEIYPSKTDAGSKLRKALEGGYNRYNFGWVLNTLGVALTSFIDAENFEQAITSAINAGWDTDSQATVAGAFAGALWGNEEIPMRWKQKLNPHSFQELEAKSEKLYYLNKQSPQ